MSSAILAFFAASSSTPRAGATITAGQSVYEDQADGKIKLADANLSLAAAKAKGLALHGALSNQPIRYQKGGKAIVGAGAAGVIVASALVDALGPDGRDVAALAALVGDLRAATLR